jgi:hypothetical protein
MKLAPLALFFILPVLAWAADQYDLTLTADPTHGKIEGDVVVTTDASIFPDGTISVSLALNQNERKNSKIFGPLQEKGQTGFSPSWARISDVEVNGTPRVVRYPAPSEGTFPDLRAIVDLAGASGTVTLRFHFQAQLSLRKAQDDFAFGDRMFSRFSWFPRLLGPGGTGRPVNAHLNLALPRGWTLVPSGVEPVIQDGRTMLDSPLPGPVPLLLVNGMERFAEPVPDLGALLVFYTPAADGARVPVLSGFARDALRHDAQEYGSPGRVIGVVEGISGTYSLAAEGSLILGGGLYSQADLISPGFKDRLCDYLVSRAVGQQTFGLDDQDTADDSLFRGLNETSAQLYLETKYSRWDSLEPAASGPGAYLAKVQADWGRALRLVKLGVLQNLHDKGWDDSLAHEDPQQRLLNTTVEMTVARAPFVLAMLASRLNVDLSVLLRDLAAQAQGVPLSPRDLERYLESRYAVDLRSFFDEFVWRPGWVDYDLGGTLNQGGGGVFRQTLTITDDQGHAEFVPTTLTLRFEDGSERRVRVEAPGPLTLETPQRVRWAAVDLGADTLDFERKNNFLPHQVPESRDDPQLDTFYLDRFSVPAPVINATSSVLSGSTASSIIQPANQGIDFGLGAQWSDRRTYQIEAAPIWNFTGANDGLGALGKIDLTLPESTTLNLTSRTMILSHYQDTTVGLTKTFYTEQDRGKVGRWLAPTYTLTGQAGVLHQDWTAPSQGRFQPSLGLTVNNLETSGTIGNVSTTTAWHWASGTEERLNLGLSQLLAASGWFFLGAHVDYSLGFGQIQSLPVFNSALGISPDQLTAHEDATGGEIFVGLPLLNNLEVPVLNLFIMQSLQLGIVYAASTAWEASGPRGSVPQSLGIGLLPVIRPFSDKTVTGPMIGVSLDLNQWAAHPQAVESYTPHFFLEFSNLTQTFAEMASF